jgi:hypothetical protein
MLCSFFRMIPRRLNFIFLRFETLRSSFIGGSYIAYEDGTECSETSAYKIQTSENHPKERIKQSQFGFTFTCFSLINIVSLYEYFRKHEFLLCKI